MAIRRPTDIQVTIRWETGRTRDGLGYAILRWREPSGRRPSRSLGYVSPEEAEVERARQEAALRLEIGRQESRGYAVADVLADYLEHVEDSPAGASHKSRCVLDGEHLARHLGPTLVESLTAHHVRIYVARRSKERVSRVRPRKAETAEEYEARAAAARRDPDGKPVSSTTIRGEIATLRRAVRWARDAGLSSAHPPPAAHRKSMEHDERPDRRLTEAEVSRLIAAAGEYSTLVEVLAWSGRRPVAIFALRARDCSRVVDLALPRPERKAWWRADKGGQGRGWGILSGPAYRAILRRLEELGQVDPDTLLWTTPRGNRWRSSTWPNVFSRIAAAAEVEDVRSYDLRKHACAQILRHTGSAHEAIKYTGHKTVEMLLRRYAYALEGSAEEAADRIDWTPAPLRLAEDAGEQSGEQDPGSGGGSGRK